MELNTRFLLSATAATAVIVNCYGAGFVFGGVFGRFSFPLIVFLDTHQLCFCTHSGLFVGLRGKDGCVCEHGNKMVANYPLRFHNFV